MNLLLKRIDFVDCDKAIRWLGEALQRKTLIKPCFSFLPWVIEDAVNMHILYDLFLRSPPQTWAAAAQEVDQTGRKVGGLIPVVLGLIEHQIAPDVFIRVRMLDRNYLD